MLGPWDAFWVLMKGAGQGPRTLGEEYPHQYKGSKCRQLLVLGMLSCGRQQVSLRKGRLPFLPRNGAVGLENYAETSASILACVSGPADRQATSFTLVVPMALAGPQYLQAML